MAMLQVSRAIVGAEMQNIVFGQYLEMLLGESLVPQEFSYYDSSVDPSVSNEFATAAFRFGHSMVQGLIRLKSRHGFDF